MKPLVALATSARSVRRLALGQSAALRPNYSARKQPSISSCACPTLESRHSSAPKANAPGPASTGTRNSSIPSPAR